MEDIRQRHEDVEADGRYTAAVILRWNVIRFRKTQLRESEILRRNGNEALNFDRAPANRSC